MEYLALIVVPAYVLLNLYVSKKIKKAAYFKEAKRARHLKFIWLLPFLGPLLLRGFWKERTPEEIEKRRKRKLRKQLGNYSENFHHLTGN